MANVLVRESSLEDIADAIRDKLNVQTTYKPSEMAAAIESIPSGGSATLGTKTITSNATYNASSDNLDGYSSVTVNVPTGTAKTSSDLTANNLTVTAPAGLYSSDASKTLTDANLTAGNIKKDVTIFGVTGSYEGGGGGGSSQVATGTFTGNNSDTITFPVSFEPDLVFIKRSDYPNMTAIADQSVCLTGILKNEFMFFNRTGANATSMAGNNISGATGTASDTRSQYNYFTYSNGTVTYKCNQGNSSYFRSSLSYTYLCVKLS